MEINLSTREARKERTEWSFADPPQAWQLLRITSIVLERANGLAGAHVRPFLFGTTSVGEGCGCCGRCMGNCVSEGTSKIQVVDEGNFWGQVDNLEAGSTRLESRPRSQILLNYKRHPRISQWPLMRVNHIFYSSTSRFPTNAYRQARFLPSTNALKVALIPHCLYRTAQFPQTDGPSVWGPFWSL